MTKWTLHPSFRVIFNWVPKVISQLLWLCITTVCDWLKKSRATFWTNQKWNQNQSWLACTRFPALGTGYMYLLRALIGSLDCLQLLWLVRVITLVLVLRHSNENRSITLLVPHWHLTHVTCSCAVARSLLYWQSLGPNHQTVFIPIALLLFYYRLWGSQQTS